jgi:hypothetical protein
MERANIELRPDETKEAFGDGADGALQGRTEARPDLEVGREAWGYA